MQDTMLPGDELTASQTKVSNSGQYRLIYQDDGNLVLYDDALEPPGVMFSTHTQDHSPGKVVLQTDGNLVIYDPDGEPLWESDTAGAKPLSLVVQDDGNLVLYAVTPVFDAWTYERNQGRNTPGDE